MARESQEGADAVRAGERAEPGKLCSCATPETIQLSPQEAARLPMMGDSGPPYGWTDEWVEWMGGPDLLQPPCNRLA